MIRYRRLYESEESNIQLYDIVSCAGFDWYIIDMNGDNVTLLAKNDDFGRSMFDKVSNNYWSSEISEYIYSDVLPKLRNVNPIPVRLTDVGVTDRVWLLSVYEASNLPREIRQFPNRWWLRSRGYAYYAADVNRDGEVNSFGHSVDNIHSTVRPAMRVRIEDLD